MNQEITKPDFIIIDSEEEIGLGLEIRLFKVGEEPDDKHVCGGFFLNANTDK